LSEQFVGDIALVRSSDQSSHENSRSQFLSSSNHNTNITSQSASDDLSNWGKAPPVNSDAYLRATWPETEALLRSVGLYHGIHTDLQSLQQINWVHRVSIFFAILIKPNSSYTHCNQQEKLLTREGQRALAHKNTAGTMAICYSCSKYRLRSAFSDAQWKKPRQKDGNVPRSCNECLSKGSVDDILNWDMVGQPDAGDTLEFTRRPPRPEHFRTMSSIDSLRDRSPDRDTGESQAKRDQEVDFLLAARNHRRQKQKRKREEFDGN
jgi:hypothetical protein